MGVSVSHETYLSTNKDSKDGRSYSAKFHNEVFAEGHCRYAFMGVLSGDGPRNGHKCVTKVFKREYAKNFVQWAPDLAASEKAQGFAIEFMRRHSSEIQRMMGKHKIEFIIPLIARMKNLSAFEILGLVPINVDARYTRINDYVAIEPFIEGQYVKFNSNGGYEDEAHWLMSAFCHWTWCISGHQFMVCDLQGTRNPGFSYILTDPAIHSYDRRFGPTDIGVVGMENVLKEHKCNQLCDQLDLKNPVQTRGSRYSRQSGPRSTTYVFQVTEEDMLRANRGKSHHFKIMAPLFE